MKIALYQSHIIWEDKEENYIHLEKRLKEVSKRTDLFLLPEMSFTGFSMNTAITKESNRKTIDKIADYAQRYNTAIGFGWVKDCGEKSENHYTIMNTNGKIVSIIPRSIRFLFRAKISDFGAEMRLRLLILAG